MLEKPSQPDTCESSLREGLPALNPDSIYPRSSAERINLMIHFHRAEIARMSGWRDRIDRTTNWSITAVGASISYALSAKTVGHAPLLACMPVVLFLLFIESRRYRFFDFFRFRVRSLEKNYYANLMSRNYRCDERWLEEIGEDLRNPIFKITVFQALRARLRRNYIWLYQIIIAAWILKVLSLSKLAQASKQTFLDRLVEASALDVMPGGVVLTVVAALYLALLFFAYLPSRQVEHLPRGKAHV